MWMRISGLSKRHSSLHCDLTDDSLVGVEYARRALCCRTRTVLRRLASSNHSFHSISNKFIEDQVSPEQGRSVIPTSDQSANPNKTKRSTSSYVLPQTKVMASRQYRNGNGSNEVLHRSQRFQMWALASSALVLVFAASLCTIRDQGARPTHPYHHRTSLRGDTNRSPSAPAKGRELNIFVLSNDYDDDVIDFYDGLTGTPTAPPSLTPIGPQLVGSSIEGAPPRPMGPSAGYVSSNTPLILPAPPSSTPTTKGNDGAGDTIVAQYQSQGDTSGSVTDSEADSSQSEQQPQQDLETPVIPVVLTGVASAVLFCALFLICGNQRDRYVQRKWERAQLRQAALVDDNSTEKSVVVENASDPFDVFGEEEERSTNSAGTGSDDGGSYWVHAVMRELAGHGASKYTTPPDMLPPLGDEEVENREDIVLDLSRSEEQEDMSLSLVSSLTQSLVYREEVGRHTSTRQQNKRQDLQRTSSNEDDVNGEPPIEAAVTKLRQSRSNEETNSSVCSSLTDGTNTTNNTLLDEECVPSIGEMEEAMDVFKDGHCKETLRRQTTHLAKIKDSPEDEGGNSQSTKSLTESSFTMSDRRDDVSLCTEMKKLEMLISSIQPEDEGPSRHSLPEPYPHGGASVREIFFMPPKKISEKSLGFSFENPSTKDAVPHIKGVELSSAFAGKLYVGDGILRVDDCDVSGLSGKDLISLMASTRRGGMNNMIKLTVMSSDLEASVDFGLTEGREEI